MSVYDLLLASWKRERSENNLIPLDPNFFDKCRAYINHLENQAKNEPDDTLSKLFTKRWNRVNYVMNDLISLRLQKHFNALIHRQTPPDQLPSEENALRKALEKKMVMYRDEVLGIVDQQAEAQELRQDDDYQLVLFTQGDNIQSIGADLNTYGPFNSDDIAYLPYENARNYLKRSQVESLPIE
ncbi:MAG: DNA replication complex subunit Gins51 [Candidatus Kariarchaeaceae archaeon]|jgi:DNA replication initiation complex subunit (GINS family)